jgi:predicted outer membrane repeat protein
MPPYVGATCDSCVYLVDGSAAAGGDGSTWAKAFNTIQPALDAANTIAKTAGSCDVWVKAGTYYLFKSDKVADGIHLYSNVGLYGGFAGTETQRTDADPAKNPTTISGYKSASGGTSVEHVVAGYDVQNATVDGFTLRDGNADGSGGNQEDSHGGGFLLYAYNTHNASATVSRCEITASSGSYGAGIGMIWGNPTITVTSCNVHGNTASGNGGGMECSGTSCTVSATTFQGNVAGNDGGGLYSGAGLVANGDTFADNIATTNGGGLRLSGVAGALTNLVFSGNYGGGNGGAMYVNGPPVSGVTNGVFVGNHAVGSGGAVYDQTSAFTCIGCTITGNHAEQQGDAIDWQTSAPTLTNSIVWGNPSVEAAASGDDVMPATWTTITASHADVHGYSGTSSTAFDADPLFVSVPAFFDVVASTGVSSSFVIVAGSGYTVGDVIEIGGDGVGRTVSQVSASVVTFSPAVAAAPPAGTAIRDWGSALATLDLHVSSGSMCIADGDASQGLSTDITGASWGGNPTLGAYTYP